MGVPSIQVYQDWIWLWSFLSCPTLTFRNDRKRDILTLLLRDIQCEIAGYLGQVSQSSDNNE